MITESDSDEPPVDPFSDLDAYVALPRVEGLWLSPDGRRVVVGVATPDRKKTRYTTALWEVDPDGVRSARRLTRSARGESAAAFTPSGDLLFLSERPDPDGGPDGAAATTALWLQRADGGDAKVVACPPGGVRGVVVSETGTVVIGSPMMPAAADEYGDKEVRARRTESAVSAILHEQYPVRHWDHDLGPDRIRLLAADLSEEVTAGEALLDLRDLTGHVGHALSDECTWDVTPDGNTVITMWAVDEPAGSQRYTLVAIDVATGKRRTLADAADHEYDSPRVSPDGTRVAVQVRRRPTPHEPDDYRLGIVPVAGGGVEALASEWDRRPHSPQWTPSGEALIVAADDHGHSPLWRVDADTGQVTRLTHGGAFSDVRVSPDGRRVHALRSAIDSPPTPVRVALDGSAVTGLPDPVEALGTTIGLPGRLEEVTTTAADGTQLRAWLSLPHDAGTDSPAPLLLWIHGGPLFSANAWSWRWNPWVAVARGYAVLQPDFALSTGYGIDFIRRGWGAWGDVPYTDLMSMTEATQNRDDIDSDRTAAMGGSFGGYMANWVAGHTDRFAAIVTHASIWALDQFLATTDGSHESGREMTPEMAEAHSPHHFADAITTPMLVVHGDKDYRVPIGEGLRLWWDLSSRSKTEDGSTPHKFLFFPDENHWVLAPNHAKVWYSTIFAFLAHHLHGEEWQPPSLLG
ncbi:dipeptidyl aminopeptidase/acylaminoacyl peptidase [Halopolyspora algeriensis]|uniref:Dipeptidyl aminopeptidase/acylaminoacyl peptidase n=1 Tax=Halopolyspora algeriensis TaxID=1500506 RepID=A0A368VGU3_9ACTN|nr:prolyl oligopeptidase family serine peptidase [Halopolyspora algeriensis]RCW40397.1 dipeptidyl aminopeptidase/acylaminoacyl peptidase [Halopolyspora algeriensis]TQM53681.1 dipeptidyl aminopeptidase/acylaminoacyl peptidase [Halopolyspora algeriensis]